MQGDRTHGQHRPPGGIGVGALFSRYTVLDLWPGMGTEGKKGPATPELGGFIPLVFFEYLFYKFKFRWKTQGSLGKRKKRSVSWTPGSLLVTLSLLMFVSSSHVMISRSKKD